MNIFRLTNGYVTDNGAKCRWAKRVVGYPDVRAELLWTVGINAEAPRAAAVNIVVLEASMDYALVLHANLIGNAAVTDDLDVLNTHVVHVCGENSGNVS